MLFQYRDPLHQVEMPSLSCSLVNPSSSKCCSASLRMPSLSGTFGAGLTGNASGKCFCNGQIASTAGSWLRGFACGRDLRLGCFPRSAFWGSFSARRRSRSSASCSKPIVLFTASRLIAWRKDIACRPRSQQKQDALLIRRGFEWLHRTRRDGMDGGMHLTTSTSLRRPSS